MELEKYIEDYNKNFYGNTEFVKCLCGNEKSLKLFNYDRYLMKNEIVICKNCGLVFANPRLKTSFLENFYRTDFYRYLYNQNLDDTKNSELFDGESNNYNNAFENLKVYLNSKKKINILEVGSGSNANLLPFKKFGNLYAIDFSKRSEEIAKNNDIAFKRGGTEVLKNFNIKFDIIVLSHVIEHFVDFNLDMQRILNVSHEGTVFYIEVPSMDIKYNLDQLQNAHNYYFTKSTFIYYLNRNYLKCIKFGIASKIHQFGIFKIDKDLKIVFPKNEYSEAIKKHKKFCFNFYYLYLINFYLRRLIKRILGKKITKLIRKIIHR